MAETRAEEPDRATEAKDTAGEAGPAKDAAIRVDATAILEVEATEEAATEAGTAEVIIEETAAIIEVGAGDKLWIYLKSS